MSKKNFFIDTILNIVASMIPIAILQLIILPGVARQLGDSNYGLVITLVSFFTMFSQPFGNVLNNIRLLKNEEYREQKVTGDFNTLLIISLFINSIIMAGGVVYYEGSFSVINVLLILIISGLNLMREYLIVAFRITLNYKAILLNNICLSLGYLFGYLLFYLFDIWHIIYITGLILSLLFIIYNSRLLTEGITRTPLFKTTAYDSIILFISVFIKFALSYADKLILFPLLGPTSVAVYYSSTILGKIISMGINPISSVMLSYFSKMTKLNIRAFINIICLTGVIGVLGYFICIYISKPFLYLLYPEWANESMKLIYVTTATALVGVITTVINPIILKFYNINWQIIISGFNLVVYIICAFTFYKFFGLFGFCVGILIANIFKLLLMICIYLLNYRKNLEN